MASKHVKLLQNGAIRISNVRISFPSLFQKATFNGDDTGKYEATVAFPKSDQDGYDLIIGEIERIKREMKIKVSDDKLFIKDGDNLEYEEFEGMWVVKASNRTRPMVVGHDRAPLIEEDGVIYAGCYVNVIISPWGQNNSWGKRVNSNLLGVQFVKDGEQFGGTGRAADVDDFDDIDDEF